LIGTSAAIKTKGGPDVYGPNGDHYSNNRADYDFSRIGIDITEAGSGDKCKPGDWATVHWKGWLKDGRQITDSRQEPGSQPKTFSVGAREVFHCWDLAIQELHQGDKARLSCPSYYVYGTAFAWAPIGGEPIPLASDVDFDIEVVECNRTPELPDIATFQESEKTN
jgi:FKBP-type peptidyl-prolyl cis-trans isomerase